MNIIKDGTGQGHSLQISSDNRALTDGIVESISAERSRKGKLFGTGTGGLSLPAGFSGPVLWFENGESDFMAVQKIIFGWNGGSTNHDRTVFSLINYNTDEPTANHTASGFGIENISKAGASLPNSSVYVWDGVGSAGMTSTGGFPQIPNRLAQGNFSIPIDGEIILGQGNTMRFDITPEEAGLFHVSVVVYMFDPDGRAKE